MQFCENDTDRVSGIIPLRNESGNPSLSRSGFRIATCARRRRSSTSAGSLIGDPNRKLRGRGSATFFELTRNLRDTSHSQDSDDCIKIHSVGHLEQPFSLFFLRMHREFRRTLYKCQMLWGEKPVDAGVRHAPIHLPTRHTPDIDSISEDFPTDWEPRTQIWGRLMSRETLRNVEINEAAPVKHSSVPPSVMQPITNGKITAALQDVGKLRIF